MEAEGREDANPEPASSTWPWLPDPTNVPAPLLQRPQDTVSDWISSDELCDVCSKLNIDEVGGIGYEHRTAHDLERVAGATMQAGQRCCPLCAMIWKRMRDHFVYYFPNRWIRVETDRDAVQYHTNTFRKWADLEAWQNIDKEVDEKAREMKFSRLMSQSGERIKLLERGERINIIHGASSDWPRVEFSDKTEELNYLSRTLSLYTLPDAPSAGRVSNHIPWRDLTQAGQYTASWTRRCVQEHTMCPKSIESPLPKRLIDVGVYGTPDKPRIWINPSLVSTSKGDVVPTSIMGTYLALSYCWGLDPFELIGPHNLAKMTEEIPVKSLPLTIQDAMEFTRLLGVRYLWVDSLCILQGESVEAKADWNEESVKMETIYCNALLTIGAGTGKSAYHGIRPTADQPEMPFCPLPEGFGGTKWPGQVYVGLKQIAHRQDVIQTRAWTFQEFLLSARYVHLGDNQIFWYCKQISWNKRRNRTTEPCPPIPDGNGLADSIERDKANAEWYRIVRDYTSRSISRAEDRLIALSGVAKDLWLRRGQHDEYLAGLWRNTITQDLIWKTNQHDYAPLSPTLPSWSWASRNKEVWYDDDHGECSADCAQFLGSRIVGDRFGHSVTGSIRLNGWVRKTFILVDDEDYEDDGDDVVHLYESKNARESFGWVMLDGPLNPEKKPISTWSSDEQSETDEYFEVLCLEIHRFDSGLLLSPESAGSNRYRRIGIFFQWDWSKTWGIFTGERCDIELV